MAVDMALWTLVAAVVGFLALRLHGNAKTNGMAGTRRRDANTAVGTANCRLLASAHRAGEALGLLGGAE